MVWTGFYFLWLFWSSLMLISSKNKSMDTSRKLKKSEENEYLWSQRMAGSLYLLKMASISSITSGGKGRWVVRKASMSSFSCSTEVAPMIELVINGRSRTNPSASWTGLNPCFFAISVYCIVASWKSPPIRQSLIKIPWRYW